MSSTRDALRRLLVVAAALVLLGHGGVELGPRLTSAGAGSPTGAGTSTAFSRPAAESQPMERGTALRGASAAAVVPAGGTEPVSGPGTGPLTGPQLAGSAVVRRAPPAVSGGTVGAATGRAPPGSAGL